MDNEEHYSNKRREEELLADCSNERTGPHLVRQNCNFQQSPVLQEILPVSAGVSYPVCSLIVTLQRNHDGQPSE